MFKEIIIELSHNCNLSCIMCGFGKEANPPNKAKFMPFDKYKIILSQIGEKADCIRLNGRGESTIHPEFARVLEYTRSSFPEVRINLFSNFSFNNSRIINSLIDNQVQLFISIDSPIDKDLASIRKGADFSLINQNIQKLNNLQIRPFIVFTIQEPNIPQIFSIAQYAFENNCHIIFNTVRRDSGIETFIEAIKRNYQLIAGQFDKAGELYADSKLQCLYPDQLAGIDIKVRESVETCGNRSTCPALENELCILYNGTVTPCNMFNPYEYGNIFNETLYEIWNGKKRADFLISHKSYYYCQNCANLGV